MKSSRSLNKLLEEADDNLAILVTKTRQLRRLTLEFRRHLDTELAPHCYISHYNGDLLSVFVDSAAWATRLRFQVPQLLPALRRTSAVFSQLGQIRVSIVTHTQTRDSVTTISDGPVMSKDNANIINSLSNDINDASLQQALRRLTRHANKQ